MRQKRKLALATALIVMGMSAAASGNSSVQGYGSVDGNFYTPPESEFVRATDWHYTFSAPSGDWPPVSLSAGAGWEVSGANNSFHSGGLSLGDPEDFIAWPSSSNELWAQSTFTVSQDEIDELMFWGRWDDHIRVFINGVEAVERVGWSSSHRYLGLSEAARASIRANSPNVLAIHARDDGGGRHLTLDVVKNKYMANPPVTAHGSNAHFVPILQYVQEIMSKYGVSAGAISIGREDMPAQIAFSASLGYMDKDFTVEVPEDAIFRLGSLDKFPVEWLIRRMVEVGVTIPGTGEQLTWNSKVFSILNQLGLQPLPNTAVDDRVDDITLQHLYDRTAGLPNSIPFDDNFFQSVGINREELTREHAIRWLYSQPLQADPGSNAVYGNTAFDVMRYFIDVVAPGGLEGFAQQELFPDSDHALYIAKGPAIERVYGGEAGIEPWYSTLLEDDDGLQIGSIGILAASAESYTKYHLERLGGGISYGATDGVHTAKRKFPLANGDGVGFTVLTNMRDSMPFGSDPAGAAPTTFDGIIEAMILDLPEDAWQVGGAEPSCKTKMGSWGNNLVANCSFDEPNARNWSVGAYNGGAAWASYSGQELKVNINQQGGEHWHVQAVTPVSLPKKGGYALFFRARAENPREIVVNVGHDGAQDNNWTSYARRSIELSPTMKAYVLTFPSLPSDAKARLDFNLGAAGTSDVVIDDVYLAPLR